MFIFFIACAHLYVGVSERMRGKKSRRDARDTVVVGRWRRPSPRACTAHDDTSLTVPQQSQFRFPANGILHCYLTPGALLCSLNPHTHTHIVQYGIQGSSVSLSQSHTLIYTILPSLSYTAVIASNSFISRYDG